MKFKSTYILICTLHPSSYRYINLIWFSCHLLAMSNSCINPFIYAIYGVSNCYCCSYCSCVLTFFIYSILFLASVSQVVLSNKFLLPLALYYCKYCYSFCYYVFLFSRKNSITNSLSDSVVAATGPVDLLLRLKILEWPE